jgi:hypothetical protein
MTMKTFLFAGYAVANPHWNLPAGHPLESADKYCLGLICLGEETYCCELTPSTYVRDLSNEFVNPDGSFLTDEQRAAIDNEGLDHESLDHGYIRYIDPLTIASNPLVSRFFEQEIDLSDFDESAYESERDYLSAISHAAWEEAFDYASGNGAALCPPILGGAPAEPISAELWESIQC